MHTYYTPYIQTCMYIADCRHLFGFIVKTHFTISIVSSLNKSKEHSNVTYKITH